MRSIPLIRQVVLAPALSYLASEGVPVLRYLRKANLIVPSPESVESLIPFHQLCDFLGSVARGEGYDDLGFRIGGQLGVESLGTLRSIHAQSLTLHELTQTSIELISSYNSGQSIWLEHHGDQVRYCLKVLDLPPRASTTEVVQLGLLNSMAAPQHVLGPEWKPNLVELAMAPMDLSRHFPQFGDVKIRFNQPFTSLWADRKVLSTPLATWNSMFSPTVTLGRDGPVDSTPAAEPLGQLEQAIESILSNPAVSLPLTASIIGLTARTLQRQLAGSQTSFSRVLRGVRFRNAQRLLRYPEMPLTQIAQRLGYTDSANFIRAFKRWTGVGPSEFRRLHFEDGCESD